MAAKGATSKEQIIAKILEYFPGAFKYEKEVRIPCLEDGVPIEIKVALTCAKENVGGNTAPTKAVTQTPLTGVPEDVPFEATSAREPSEEEKANLAAMMAKLGL